MSLAPQVSSSELSKGLSGTAAGLNASSCYRINCYNALNAQSPFGGFKMSGNGREM